MLNATDRILPSGEAIAELALRVDDAASEALTPWEVSTSCRLTDEERKGPLGIVKAAFDYGESYERSREASFFVPMMEGEGFCYPPHIKDVPTVDGLLWGGVADSAASPVVRARLNDLCFEGRWGSVGERGRAAVSAYLEMSAVDVYALDDDRRPSVAIGRVDWLGRALSLSSKMGDTKQVDVAVTPLR